jgi:hypothetical protein
MKLSTEDKEVILALMLNPLRHSVKAALHTDEAFCETLGIKPRFSIELDKDLRADARSLNDVLRHAVAGRKTASLLVRDDRRLRVKLGQKTEAGAASFVVGKRGFTFNDADLLSSDRERRDKALDRVFEAKPLWPRDEDAWREISRTRAFGDREYVDLMTSLAATPEGLIQEFIKPKNLNSDELMPDGSAYYHLLVPPVANSTEFSSYIEKEFSDACQNLVVRHPRSALRRIAFCALRQNLVPFAILRPLGVAGISTLLAANDPFSLLCGFELCRDQLASDPAFSDLGASFLERLLLDAEAENRHYIFSACALISSLRIRRSARASGFPVFWARLAALSHAGVLADALAGMPDAKEFFRWASEHFYPSYAWHCAVDLRDAPRWRYDWISPDHLYAELVGRALGALHALPEGDRPRRWIEILEAAQARLKEMQKTLASMFPGPFDDFVEVDVSYAGIEVFNEVEQALDTATTLDVPGLYPLVCTFKPSARLVANVLRIVERSIDDKVSARAEVDALGVAAHIAGVSRHEGLAQAVINRCLSLAREPKREEGITDIFEVMTKACAAWSSHALHRKRVAEAAAKLCFIIDDEKQLGELAAVFNVLSTRDERLKPALAKPQAIIGLKTRFGMAVGG